MRFWELRPAILYPETKFRKLRVHTCSNTLLRYRESNQLCIRLNCFFHSKLFGLLTICLLGEKNYLNTFHARESRVLIKTTCELVSETRVRACLDRPRSCTLLIIRAISTACRKKVWRCIWVCITAHIFIHSDAKQNKLITHFPAF